MLHSMTGFARESVETALGTLTWEVRTVNHRYLDVQFKLPEELRPQEQTFRQQASATLGRGKVECGLYFRRAGNQQSDMQLDTDIVKLLRARIAEVNEILPEIAPTNALDVLRWPGVMKHAEVDGEPLVIEATTLLATTLSAVGQMRLSEGQRIAEMLEARCNDIDTIASSVRKRLPEVLATIRCKQRERIEKLNIDADPGRLEVELALIAQKIDVDEELDRLESHLVEIRSAIAARKPVGRRLDFLMQELNREANTLGSKSADTQTTKAAVDLKVLIEQMREQIQNVE